MSRRARRNHTGAFKAKVALAALKEEKTLLEFAQQSDVHANQITQWKSQLLEGEAGIFGGEAKAAPIEASIDVKTLHAKIGQLTLKNGFLEGALTKAGLMSVKLCLTSSTTCPSSNRPRPWASAAAASTTSTSRVRSPLRTCG